MSAMSAFECPHCGVELDVDEMLEGYCLSCENWTRNFSATELERHRRQIREHIEYLERVREHIEYPGRGGDDAA